jgi:L-aspartate oxidase
MSRLNNSDPVIIGAGAAGLMAALCLAPRPVTVLCAGALGIGAASGWAQGGIAAAVGADDSVALHEADTIAAGAGLCDRQAVARIIAAGPWAIETLQRYGANFAEGLGLEAAHSRRRIVHAADATGAEIMRALIAAARATPSITIIEHASARELAVRDNAVAGVHACTTCGPLSIATGAVIIATGGVGGLFTHTTNPRGATGSGIALAARAGAALRDLEFVQFHPTALGCGLDPMPLISEALRGEGAVFVDETGAAFMQGGDLAARDIVARAVAAKISSGGQVFLDARRVNAAKFPGIFATCRANGIDSAHQPIPVRPAAHYHMGGIAVDAHSESSVSGLFACGEAAATGLHGANRLASNSLLEAVVTGREAAAAISGRSGAGARPLPAFNPRPSAEITPRIREVCSQHLGILRDAAGLTALTAQLTPLASRNDAALVALLIGQAALRRRESRGAHFRTDFPQTDAAQATPVTTQFTTQKRAA